MVFKRTQTGKPAVVGHHRSVGDVLEHAVDVTVDVAHTDVRIGERLVIEARHELVLVRQLGVGIDLIGADFREDEVVCRISISRMSVGV